MVLNLKNLILLLISLFPSKLKIPLYSLFGYKISRNVSLGFLSIIDIETKAEFAEGSKIAPFTYIKAKEFYIGKYSIISPFSFISVPKVYIGNDTKISNFVIIRSGHISKYSELFVGDLVHIFPFVTIDCSRKVAIGDGMAGANQCEERNKYHINIETSYMEILDLDYKNEVKPGDEGIIVVTSLNDYAMPFIRYTPGDMAIQGNGPCPCGRGLPILEKIIGRSSDLFKLANGRILNGLSIPFEDWADKIEKFQLIQEEPDLIILKLIPKDNYTEKDESQIMDLLKYNAGDGIRIQIEKVKNLEFTSAGKFKYVISKI